MGRIDAKLQQQQPTPIDVETFLKERQREVMAELEANGELVQSAGSSWSQPRGAARRWGGGHTHSHSGGVSVTAQLAASLQKRASTASSSSRTAGGTLRSSGLNSAPAAPQHAHRSSSQQWKVVGAEGDGSSSADPPSSAAAVAFAPAPSAPAATHRSSERHHAEDAAY